ncbi:MAG: tetratricopeptide repeat protein [Deltaproteobacteria bacterium]|nr:tetratricopeptide repeat protein [Deltaproteobacteria bacterium]
MRRLHVPAALVVLVFASASFAAGGGGGGGGGGGFGGGSSPQEIALGHFEAGEKARKQALDLFVEAQAATDPKARAKAVESANAKLKRAQRSYKEATRADGRAFYAWNGIGFCQRMLGDNEAALASYDKALKIEPGFPQAVEYRGEAYMNLGKLDEAKAAYMDLFARERALADMLLKKMQAWVAAAKQNSQTPGAQARLDEFAKWVDERAALAQETASLAAPGSGAEIASW